MPKKTAKKTVKKASNARKSTRTVHELEVSLLEIDPRIWRRFVVPSNSSLDTLHIVVQVVMGWTNSHLHQFVTPDETQYAIPSPFDDLDWGEKIHDSRKANIAKILPVPPYYSVLIAGKGLTHFVRGR